MGHVRKPRSAKGGGGGFKPPTGFKTMDVKGTYAPTHDFFAEPEIVGKVVEIRNVPKGGMIKKDTRIMVVRTDKGDRSVWEAAGLTTAFDNIKKGKQVWISHHGTQKIKGRRQEMHVFTVAVK